MKDEFCRSLLLFHSFRFGHSIRIVMINVCFQIPLAAFDVPQGVQFFADEALKEALHCYRECRELCVDLIADEEEEVERRGDATVGVQLSPKPSEAASTPTGGLIRAEFNLGMVLVEQKRHDDAIGHLLAVEDGCRKLAGISSAEDAADSVPGSLERRFGNIEGHPESGIHEGSLTVRESNNDTNWKAFFSREGASELGGLYASSLEMLGECWISASSTRLAARFETLSRLLHQARDEASGAESAKPLLPLGALISTAPARIKAAVATLEQAVDAFLMIDGGDATGALDALKRLIRVLRLQGGERYFLRAEALCDRVSGIFGKGRRHDAAPGVITAGDISDDDEDYGLADEVDKARGDIQELRLSHDERRISRAQDSPFGEHEENRLTSPLNQVAVSGDSSELTETGPCNLNLSESVMAEEDSTQVSSVESGAVHKRDQVADRIDASSISGPGDYDHPNQLGSLISPEPRRVYRRIGPERSTTAYARVRHRARTSASALVSLDGGRADKRAGSCASRASARGGPATSGSSSGMGVRE